MFLGMDGKRKHSNFFTPNNLYCFRLWVYWKEFPKSCRIQPNLLAQADRLGPKVGGRGPLCWICHMNRVNSCNGSVMMTPAPGTLAVLLLFFFYYYYFFLYNNNNNKIIIIITGGVLGFPGLKSLTECICWFESCVNYADLVSLPERLYQQTSLFLSPQHRLGQRRSRANKQQQTSYLLTYLLYSVGQVNGQSCLNKAPMGPIPD